ncbi:MAG: hypothetical protein IJE45_00335, partial [Bacilli bacterium]|nr:hypothetical protein [Bacilli bacterium]
MRRDKKFLKFLAIIFVIVSIILVIALYSNSQVESPFKLVKSESTYLIIALFAILPILFILLIVGLKMKSNEVIKVDGNVNAPVNGQIVGSPVVQPTVPVAGTSLQKVDKEKKPKENKTRFYMLSQIDANRSKYQRSSY